MGSADGWADTATGATLAMVQPRSDEEKAALRWRDEGLGTGFEPLFTIRHALAVLNRELRAG